MHTTLVWASKGGSGKTTTVGNLGASLAISGYDVLLVGMDPDGDLEQLYGIDPLDPDVVRLEQLIANPAADPQAAAIDISLGRGGRGRLRMLASTQRLEASALPLAQRQFSDLRRILDTFEDEDGGGVDLALIDVPGARGPFVTAAARAADSILLPVQPGDFERAAVFRTLQQIDVEAGFAIPVLGAVFVNTPLRSRALRQHAEAFAQDGVSVFKSRVRRASTVVSDPSRGGPSALVNRKSDVAKDYKSLAGEVVDRIQAASEQAET